MLLRLELNIYEQLYYCIHITWQCIIGHKKDVWIAVDPMTGEKQQTLSMDGTQKVCPSNADNVIYIGRSGEHVYL